MTVVLEKLAVYRYSRNSLIHLCNPKEEHMKNEYDKEGK
jgi:hypothetical protein